MIILYNRMSKLSVAVLKPHYIDRTEQFDKKQIQKIPKSKRTEIPHVKKVVLSPHVKERVEDHEKIGQLKRWLLKLLTESKNSWQEELNAKKALILQMKTGHKEKLMAILKYIQKLRKKAYEQFKHVCDKPKGEGCFHCRELSQYFNNSVKNYLSKQDGLNRKQKKIKRGNGKQNSAFDKNDKSNGIIDKSIDLSKTRKSLKRQQRFTHSYKETQQQSNYQTQKAIELAKRSKLKTIQSRFTKNNSIQSSKQNTLDKGSQLQIKLHNQQGSQEYDLKLGIAKREQIGQLRSRFRKSTQNGGNSQQNSGRRDSANNRRDDLNRSRDSGSIRKSIIKISNGNFQQGEHPKSHFRSIENDQVEGSQATPAVLSRKGKFGLNFNGQGVDELIAQSLRKKKTTKGRNNKYLRKNSDENAEIGLSSAEQNGSGEDDDVKRERTEIEQLVKQKQEMKQQHFKKITRYRRERMFYDILKREIMKAEGIQQGNANQSEQLRDTQICDTPSVTEINISKRSSTSMNSSYSRVFKNYSLLQRKESLFNKLSMLNQEKNFESLKNKIEQMLKQRGQMLVQLEKEEKLNGKSILQKFLSEVMRTKDLKRLMKQKFMKQAVWSPQMREMHQFYTFLEYSMQTFRSKITKITESNWRQLGYEGKFAQSGLDNLILDSKIGNWKGIQTANFSQQHHREIECSMKYYGIDVKRVTDIEHTNYEIAQDLSQNPIFSVVGQRSMKDIEELTKDFCSFY